MKGGIRSIKTPVYNITLYELLKTYSVLKMQKAFKIINIPKLPVFSAEEGIRQIKENFEKIKDWKELEELIPQKFKQSKKLSRTGLAGIFAASLELTKQGTITKMQKKIFEKLLIKKIN